MNVDDLILNIKDGNNVGANKQFNTVMADKMTAALDAKKIEIASGMIQRKAEEKFFSTRYLNEINNRIRRKQFRSYCRTEKEWRKELLH